MELSDSNPGMQISVKFYFMKSCFSDKKKFEEEARASKVGCLLKKDRLLPNKYL